MTLGDWIAEAERRSLHLVTLMEHERAAYFAALYSDPFSRPTYERTHRRAKADWDTAFELFDEAVTRLTRLGMAHFAQGLCKATWQRCLTAFDLAANAQIQPDRKDAIRELERSKP